MFANHLSDMRLISPKYIMNSVNSVIKKPNNLKRYSSSLIIREIQTKTTRYYLTPIRMAIIKKTKRGW